MNSLKAFTLIELIIVIAIIALLSTLGLSTYNAVQQEARNSKRKADLKELKAALESYKLENNNQYPSTVGISGCITSPNTPGRWCGFCSTYGSKTDYVPGLATTYIDALPHDPRGSKVNTSSARAACQNNPGENCYLYISDGLNYKLLAHCTPEGTMSSDDPFYDPCRPTWAWQISSSPGVKGSGATYEECIANGGW